MNSEYQDQVSQPIIFKRGTSLVAPVLLWLMDALPAVLAGVMFYPLHAHLRRRVRQARSWCCRSSRPRSRWRCCRRAIQTRRSSRGRLELATNLLLRWAVLVAALLALGYVTKFSEDFSRRVVVTWVLVTPVLLVICSWCCSR